jgi:tetratricopeptide (TPR) repeat protein
MVAIPQQGHLEELPLPRLLLELHTARFDGALVLSRDRIGKRVLFQQGSPVFAESNLASESLGVQLMDTGRLSRPDYDRVVAHIEARGCQEGKALLELGLLKPRELFDALKDQVRIRTVECFGWPQGEFQLDADAAPPEDAAPFRSDVFALVQAGIETHWSSDRILGDLMPRLEAYPQPTPRFADVATRLARDAAVEALLEALDGSRSFWKAVQLAATPRALAAAWVLDAADALAYAASPEADDAEAEVEAPERDIEIVVEERAERPAARRSAGARARGAAARQPDARAEALQREILERHESLRDIDGYTLLGVARDASTADIKRSYLKAAKTYHPDALARMGLDAETREKANKVFAEISKAHAVLSDVKRRREYDAALEVDVTDLDAERLARAEMSFRKGEILMRQGNYRGALDYLRPAVELWPDECAYRSALGWALYKKTPPEPEEARVHLEEAARLDPDHGETLLRLSRVLRDLGEEGAARDASERAHRIDPSLDV